MRHETTSVLQDVANNLVFVPISNTHIEVSTIIAEHASGLKDLDLTHSFIPHTFFVGEFCPKFITSVKNKSVYISLLPSPYRSPDDLMGRAQKVAQAAKENHAKKVVLLATDFPDARQDRGPQEDAKAHGELNSVRMHARSFEAAGIDQIITTHEHTPRISAFYALEYGLIHAQHPEWISEQARSLRPRDVQIPAHMDPGDENIQKLGRQIFKSISPHALLADYLLHHSSLVNTESKHYLENNGASILLKAMDKGNRKFIDDLYEALFLQDVSKMYCNKIRAAPNDPKAVEVEVLDIIGCKSVDGMLEIYADDGLDTGGTMIKHVQWSEQGNLCSQKGHKYGVPEDRFIYFTHPWLGGESHEAVQRTIYEKIKTKEFVTTNTRPYINEAQHHHFKKKSTVLRFADLWGDAIVANELGHDLGARYTGFSSQEEQHEFLQPLYNLKRHTRHFLSGPKTHQREVPFYLR